MYMWVPSQKKTLLVYDGDVPEANLLKGHESDTLLPES